MGALIEVAEGQIIEPDPIEERLRKHCEWAVGSFHEGDYFHKLAKDALAEIATLTERLRVAEEALERLDEHPDVISACHENKPSTMLRRVRKARVFPDNTCPASRHVQIIAEYLIRGERYDMIESEPVHVGSSMLSVVTSLYEARTELAKARAALAAIREG